MDSNIEPGKTALVIFHMQKMLVAGYGEKKRNEIVTNIRSLISGCHGAGIPVMYMRNVHRPDRADMVSIVTDWVLQGKAKPYKEAPAVIDGEPSSEFVEELKPLPEDYIVSCYRLSAFHGTPLETLLRARGINTIILCGVATDWGVASTLRSARDRDFNVIVPHDACAGTSAAAHAWFIESDFPRFARVMDTARVVSLISK